MFAEAPGPVSQKMSEVRQNPRDPRIWAGATGRKMRSNATLAWAAMLLLLASCTTSENAPGADTQDDSNQGQLRPTMSCVEALSVWSGLAESEFYQDGAEPEHLSELEFASDLRRWLCMPEGFDEEGEIADGAPLAGIGMMTPDRRAVAFFFFGFEHRYVAINPCSQAWSVAEEAVEAGLGVEEENQAIDDATWACMSVDEWWSNLQDFPTVFGVTGYQDEDRWSYLAASCPSENDSEMCTEARVGGLLNP